MHDNAGNERPPTPITAATRRTADPGRIPPHNIEAEESLLGACLLAPDAIRAAHTCQLTASSFYRPQHAHIWAAIDTLHTHQTAIDIITVGEELRRNNQLDHVGGLARLREIQAATPASANAPHYAQIIADLAHHRDIITTSTSITDATYTGQAIDALVARLILPPPTTRVRAVPGGTFTLDVPDTLPAVWGTDDRVLWAEGEELLLVGPPGVGKTTVAAQLVAARIGLTDTLLDLPVTPAQRVLYLACDRPSQIQRAFHRLFGTAERDLLNERLVVWKGPPPRDLAKHPDTLTELAREHHADCVFIDSLKDVALGISDDEIGAGLNSAIQRALAEQIEVCALHHQRKGKDGTKPKTLEDVYGSTWVTAGAGSVVLLWGQAGDPIVELVHLKQPAAEIGPLQLDHDHNHGTTTIFRGDVDPLRILRNSPIGVTAPELATISTGREKPTDVQRRKAKRTLDKLVMRGLAHMTEGRVGGTEGASADRYYATDTRDAATVPNEPEEPF